MTEGITAASLAVAAMVAGGMAAASYLLGISTVRDQQDDATDNSEAKPSRQAVIAGLAGGASAALAVWRVPESAVWPALVVLLGVGGALALLDLGYQRLPRMLITPAYGLSLALLIVASNLDATWWPLIRAVLTSIGLLAAFTLLALLTPGSAGTGGVGGGDIRLVALIGLPLGWLDPRRAVAAVIIGMLLAAVSSGIRIARHTADRHTRIPLAPYLLLGALLAACVPA